MCIIKNEWEDILVKRIWIYLGGFDFNNIIEGIKGYKRKEVDIELYK